jgi:hypothetical protein
MTYDSEGFMESCKFTFSEKLVKIDFFLDKLGNLRQVKT